MLDMVATGPFTACLRDGAWVVLDGRGDVFFEMHGEMAHHDAPLLAERLTKFDAIAEKAEHLDAAEARAEEAESERAQAEADLEEATSELNDFVDECTKLRTELAALRGEAVPS